MEESKNSADTTLYDLYVQQMITRMKNLPISKEVVASLPLGFHRTGIFPNRRQRSEMRKGK